MMSAFTPAEIKYLQSQRLGRIATVGSDGRPHVVPVGFRYNPEFDTVDIGGHDFAKRKKFRDVQRNPHVAFVVDDVASVTPWRVRGIEIRGEAEILETGGQSVIPGFDVQMFRIRPTRVISWGLESDTFSTNAYFAHNVPSKDKKQAVQYLAWYRRTDKPLMSRTSFFNIFRFFMAINVFLYRLTGGKFGSQVQGLPVLLLTTIGRRTGKKRITPLGYLEHDGSYVITASNAGFDTHPAWFHNLKSHPQVALQIGHKQLVAIAELANPTLRQQLWAKFVERAPGYGAYEERTTREIPTVLLRPVSEQLVR